ncbi:hypothetical protein NSK_007920 [Nannochloropsis salina CCMP1776]|uniref:Uncharacterized protein n=1 Tax=Nannochloropsis salina CCMP1776 TaxID=1027361 RepID=A0A4D9CT73_9STRA|nr:hypothetical protein NSK_007920 [Nannochloropsis salina CCMP1776]|eukprot:TFJ80743.1 hypothetical protein NSK_007920 [Nannochloropsis salina CCMP1776]
MCRSGLWFIALAFLASIATSTAFLVPFPERPLPCTRCQATAFSTSGQVNRCSVLRFWTQAAVLPALVLLSPDLRSEGRALAQAASPVEEALTRVLIVRDSTEQLEEELTSGDTYPDVKALVNSLIRNYKLKSSMESALALLPSGSTEEGRKFAKSAYENLTIILEYFPEDVAGPIANKTLKPDQLSFTIKALQATRKELDSLLGLFPTELRGRLAENVANT